ncbi:MAG: flagellar basal body rod protein FlgC [Alphaproteobacteria bacterium]|mgnify:CR=1 FL=1|nr:flagellar basal body rod protein FlgC [Alphaproteobacteria bacterium]
MEMMKSMLVAAAGMRAQAERWRVIAENMANASSTAAAPGEDPYRRRIPVFKTELDRATGVETVKVSSVVKDMSEFREQFMPGHPAADSRGYVKMPNVSSLIEMADMREAQRSYEANLSVIDNTRSMLARTVDLLKR